jgi:hypothetical protein
MNAKTALLLFFMVAYLSACASEPLRTDGKKRPPTSSGLKISSFVKTDIDTVAEIHQQESFSHLRTLMEKLYRRNPREWQKGGQSSMESAIARAFDAGYDWRIPELNGKRGAECFSLAFQEGYQGDRVLAFVAGLATMIMASYNDKAELYVLDELDPQKLYNSARNIEIAVWKLSGTRNGRGELFLLSNENDATHRNLSFEREFGKLIAQQDTLARIIAEKSNRTIVRAVQSVASVVFLPI